MSREFIELMTEIGFQICKLEDGTIDKDEFVQAINSINSLLIVYLFSSVYYLLVTYILSICFRI